MTIDFETVRFIATLNELAEMLNHGALSYSAAKERRDFKGVIYDDSAKEVKQDDPDSPAFECYKVVSCIQDETGDRRLLHYEPPFTPYIITFCRRLTDGFQYLSVDFEDCVVSLTIESGCWYVD